MWVLLSIAASKIAILGHEKEGGLPILCKGLVMSTQAQSKRESERGERVREESGAKQMTEIKKTW